MAALAARSAMRTPQREFALLFVVEALLPPRLLPMAVPTAIAEAPHVRIIDRVAGDALARRILVAIPCMAADTTGLAVRSLEAIVGAIVVESVRFP